MSAPPPSAPGGGPPRRPPPGAVPPFRKKVGYDPLVARKKPRPKPTHALPPKQTRTQASSITSGELDPATEREYEEKVRALQQQRAKNNGWSEPAPNAAEFPLVITKKSLLEGIRHHVMRLNRLKGDEDVDITNQDQFPRPVTLHRRDPRLPPAHRMIVKEESAPLDPAEAAEQERQRQIKADKEAQRALDQAQIAPVARDNNPKPKPQNNKKDKATAFYGKHSDAHKKQSGLRYEETLPWHLEDADGKAGVWVGSYVAGLSDTNAALVIDGDRFRMIPLERWYKFDEKPRFDTLTLDDAEKLMYEVKDVKRWVMKDKDREAMEKERAETRRFLNGGVKVKTESETSRAARRTERQDDFELDMSGDEFQDDDETPGFEADDEDTKDSKDRIRREQVAANLFGEGEEDKVEQEEREKQLEKLKRKIVGKHTIQNLKKLEKAMDYEDESESDQNNPFTESSESEDSDEEEKKEEEKKPDAKDPAASGANTKGNTTPSKIALNKKGKLKRAGSPGVSESSDNENARKKIKTGKGSVAASRGATPIPGRPKVMAGATSDGEATAGEGSDGGALLKKKLKLKASGARPGGTPSGSRAGSPAPAGSQANKTPSGSPPPADRITQQEIIQALSRYPNGVGIVDLIREFNNRLDKPGCMTKKEWITIVKSNSTFNGKDKLLRPKPT